MIQQEHQIELLQADVEYSKRGRCENPKFWSRLGGKPLLRGKTVCEVGCGHGSLCIDIALSGAKKIVALDINSRLIDFAKENLRRNYPQLTNIIEFKNIDLKDYHEYVFDYIISKNSFEHIINLDRMLIEMKRCLKLGGIIYTGFGPLYNSPFGDHGMTKAIIPWGHLLIKESILINMLNRNLKNKINSIYDLGLNKMSLANYQRVFQESGLSIIYFRINQSSNIISKLFSIIRRIPFLEEYFSHNIYCILKKSS